MVGIKEETEVEERREDILNEEKEKRQDIIGDEIKVEDMVVCIGGGRKLITSTVK